MRGIALAIIGGTMILSNRLDKIFRKEPRKIEEDAITTVMFLGWFLLTIAFIAEGA